MAQHRRRWWIPAGVAAGLSALALALALGQIAAPPSPTPRPQPASPGAADPAGAPAAPASRPRSAAELRDALLQGGSLPEKAPSRETTADGAPSPEARPPAGGSPVAWATLHEGCLESVRRSQPLQTLRLTGSTGFIPSSSEAAARLGQDWDQAIRLDLEPAAGGPPLRVECYFRDGALVTSRAS
ncbi:MAG: hypothetical protein ACK55X_10970 [Synechococcaceae cyanobacterium]